MFYLDRLHAIILQLVYIDVSLLCLDTVFEGMLECLEWGFFGGVFLGFFGEYVVFGFLSCVVGGGGCHLPIFLDFLSS